MLQGPNTALVLAIHTLYPPKIHQKLIGVILLTDGQTPRNINWVRQHHKIDVAVWAVWICAN